MYIDDQTRKLPSGKTNRRVVLRNSYRVNGKVQHDTIANLTRCSDEEIQALKLALKHKGNLSELKNIQQTLKSVKWVACLDHFHRKIRYKISPLIRLIPAHCNC